MKYTALCAVGSLLFANTVTSGELIGFHLVEWGNYGPDATRWRLFAEFDNQNDQLTNVGGSPSSNGAIQSYSGFFQSPFGGPTSLSINPGLWVLGMLYDSWVTIGLQDMIGSALTHTGIDFSSFEAGGDLFINDGSWSLPQDDPAAFGIELDGLENFHVLVGQFTTFGYGSESAPWGQLNLSGFSTDGDGVQTPWSVDGLTFGTPIPAPATALLLGIAVVGLRRRRSS